MPSLIKNHFKIAIRNLFRQRGYSAISIGGLAVALAVSLLMLLWVQDEWNTDKFHAHGDRLFLLKRTVPQADGSFLVEDKVPYLLLQAAQKDLPEVEHFIALGWEEEMTLNTREKTFRAKGISSNAAFFESFSFPILKGTVEDLAGGPPTIALSESLAYKFFGDEWSEKAVGSSISMNDVDTFAVNAVFQDFPVNSSIQYDFVYSFDSFLERFEWMMAWENSGAKGALLLAEDANEAEVAQKLEKIFQSHLQGDLKEGCRVQKFEDSYLYGQFDKQAKVAGGRIEYVQMFALAALLLLIISCINFVNLATARASKRAKEVGVRKTIGASKKSLISQFMVEAGVITIISIGLALLLAQLVLPQLQFISDKMLQFDYFSPLFWASIGGILLLTTLLSGTYPAFILSSFRPTEVLKGKIRHKLGGIGLRKGLVITQFVLALLLVVSAFVIKEQVQYIQEKHLGISKDNLIMIERGTEISDNYQVLKDELLKAPGIEQVTIGPSTPLDIPSSTTGVSWPGKQQEDQNLEFRHFWAASNFLETVEVSLVAGRFYREDAPYDTNSIVLNEKAVAAMGLKDPIGQTVQWWGQQRQIIGVVEDFHIQSLYENIKPLGRVHFSFSR
ncbi:MAG: ABC transporter permease [Bacteroidota bacterium]